ncbi:hypothetical protein ESB00_04760 [Oleiharenicola lentus]|uniref:Uncharacterized protein n=1 Tax=Oleiharenicola lentus TaxID=2508720 RepID=A0A4Q1C8N3_9BACT|nr:hypothetical protein [Oleiharenicola lentus]RXK55211.1 hypothetical protein ESB00_04760 [Oleiharenicola lentus]
MSSLQTPDNFNWPLAYEAEALLSRHINAFLEKNSFAAALAQRMHAETGTEFFEWVDHFVVSPEHEKEFRAAGFVPETTEVPAGQMALAHPHAMLPRVLVAAGAAPSAFPRILAIRPEFLADFMGRHGLTGEICGAPGARLRQVRVGEENGATLLAVERLGYRGFVVQEPPAGFATTLLRARELWRTRKRNFANDDEGVQQAFAVLEKCIGLVGRDVACELFFAEEREFWMFRNRAGRVQKRRQDMLGLGWANHDHHTYRCSRRHFPDLVKFMERLGLEKRERFYAGAEAGWGAQVMETAAVGIVVFADVDLLPDEVNEDYAAKRLPEVAKVGTVGLWCGLHGDSFLQAGMHHLEARFNHPLLREQLAAEGIATMRPFSDFPFLKQAFTEGERWTVDPGRVERLRARGSITDAQAAAFVKDGAIGSHLENLERKGGFKGFNQKAVSAIIAAVDPRNVREVSHTH